MNLFELLLMLSVSVFGLTVFGLLSIYRFSQDFNLLLLFFLCNVLVFF